MTKYKIKSLGFVEIEDKGVAIEIPIEVILNIAAEYRSQVRAFKPHGIPKPNGPLRD